MGTGPAGAAIGAGIGGFLGGWGGGVVGAGLGGAGGTLVAPGFGTVGGGAAGGAWGYGIGATGGAIVGGLIGNAIENAYDNIVNAGAFPAGVLPADVGSELWGRQAGIGAKAGRRIFHGIKHGCKGQGARGDHDFGVDPDTGDVYNPDGDFVGNLGDP